MSPTPASSIGYARRRRVEEAHRHAGQFRRGLLTPQHLGEPGDGCVGTLLGESERLPAVLDALMHDDDRGDRPCDLVRTVPLPLPEELDAWARVVGHDRRTRAGADRHSP